jgi:2-keto-4-pentenoate hydratase/2-oxohepta-3-ene-1,7-dioic acid hydratase in catechol pathway
MKYCRFTFNGGPEYGLVEPVAGSDSITHLLLTPPEEATDPRNIPTRGITPITLSEANLLAPVRPTKIVCVGRNYREHAAEMGNQTPQEPLLFLKPPSSLLDPGQTILRPKTSQRTDYEGELGVVIGKRCHKLSPDEDVRSYILGYTVVNDFTARDLQRKDTQWTRGKGYDTFCPVGPVVTDEIDPWKGVTVETRVNGELRQHGSTRDFIFPLDVIIRYAAEFMTLMPGDLIPTGTPEGVTPVVAGDVVEVSVEGIGTLRNPVADEQ